MMNSQAPTPGLDALLQNARRRSGLTQEQLAGLSTVSVRAIRDLEQGRVQHPRKETLRLLAGAMRLSDARRIELELAVDAHSVGRVFQDSYGAELAAPPTPLRPLVGRVAELEALTFRLSTEHERLLTLVGLPGVGKSRLAQEATLRIHARDQVPVLWVPMDRPDENADTADRSPQSTMVGWVRSLVRDGEKYDELAAVIGSKPTLIVLDGHDASPVVSPPVLNLLRSCERLKILITSRRPVQPPGGRLLPLAPLPVPVPAGTLPGDSLVTDRPAVELMLSYVSHMRPDVLPTDALTTTLADICHALDGIPQALEAAASWLLLYSPEQLLDVARTTPLVLVDGVTPADPASGATLGDQLSAVVTGLNPHATALLDTLAALPEPWTVDDAAHAAGTALAETARDVHALLLRGLIRQHPSAPGGPVGFTVLNLVRELLEAGRGGADEINEAVEAMAF
ncbi:MULTISPECIES: helix-turn-helix domain-containing protein [unclassified Streptomyces]|uniref:helix-turn-helix domain-containing protein n=2 Tax=Streptomyces TaxID=1883 RepID=UPI002E81A786|nr:helix-turn-helix domain-containing protein [Streptomyces sp. NBC_00589]